MPVGNFLLCVCVCVQEGMAHPEGWVPAAAEAQHDVTEEMHQQDGAEGTNGDG